jgi:F0F1-type ATP synthase membrane subunit b/b'
MVLRIEKLYKYAKTPVQKQAVEKFKNEVSNAIATRRAAIDQAIQTYRKTLDAVFDENRTVIDTVVKNFQAETAKALNQAKVECNQQSTGKIARQRLMAKSQTAQKHLTLALKFNTQPATQAAEALEEATEEATKTFNQALQKAQTELSKAFR